ncbi:ThiF family adenylyltransferase [Microbacterium sp. NPDC076911]|uniref:ThiF family adenylyltransferase n=1 Tax=Microbacterium sp. NPDC076911 TaxID=3154958 RepID=UPI00341EAA5F
MTLWEERIAATRVVFGESLEHLGWRPAGDSEFESVVQMGESEHHIRIQLGPDFPFTPPRVFPPLDTPASWHRELDGAMCLYPEVGRGSLPWLDAADLCATINLWLQATDHGWPADAPDMDLERYFEPLDEMSLVIYDERMDKLVDRLVRFNVEGPRIVLAGAGARPRKSNRRRNRLYGYITDIGEPERPPRGWEDLISLLDDEAASTLVGRADRGDIDLLMLRYSRKGAVGAVALFLVQDGLGFQLRSVPSASIAHSTLALRGGHDVQSLGAKRVLVVGAGSIGSFICDYLARSGVGSLTIRDPDVLRPGNSVRHLVASQFAGFPKVTAIKYVLDQRPGSTTEVEVDTRSLRDAFEVPELLAEYDLVIDASADGAASAMLADAARTLGVHIVSASLQNEGRIVRADVIPPVRGEPIPAVELDATVAKLVFEAGCGDPVSMTPPYAANEAASLAARLAIDLLLRPASVAAGTVHAYI